MADRPNHEPLRRIGEHGIIGDLRTCALIAFDGTIDFLCWPNLDSPSVFSALLDNDDAGAFHLYPDWPNARRQQLYLPDSNILQTRWLDDNGLVELTDFMPIDPAEDGTPRIVRRLVVRQGEARFTLRCAPVQDYARAAPCASLHQGVVDFTAPGQPTLRLAASVALHTKGAGAQAHFVLKTGESAEFVFGGALDKQVNVADNQARYTTTLAYWQRWCAKSTYRGRWRERVNRSALALKLLTSRRDGSIAAAATFGLPEHIGGERNWDYRASWIRDASFSVYALMRLGYTEEASAFGQWVGRCMENSCFQPGKLQVMYRLDSSTDLPEINLPHLSGYAGSKPVRIGNEAYRQLQLDIYGELMDAIYLGNKYGESISHRGWQHVVRMIDHVCDIWEQADAGIWEMRGEPQHYLHSRLMCWVAIDRALRLGTKRSLSMPYERWNQARAAIRDDIWTHFWNQDLGHFTATRHGTNLDASMLLMPLFRFVSATDPDWLATLDAIKNTLIKDGLVRRYQAHDTPADPLRGQEGAFAACSFWYVECLARADRLEEAQFEFEKLLSYANPLGLYAEEFDARGYPLGNIPQGLTHLALISAAFFLDRKLSRDTPQWQP
ncbi:glycoside hydrolase family 15 protein [Acerihabitans sp. TG2]|uniref:glycoside hydrolase family 15 protein n=1 Tax=Acerihabitans sp. TG2 TaxID=3096008 RepID=UPI002B237313|nr:glycoside hydrolase family 15 protein [Acerihabitans sp. TG2]MEA9391448.1 glycoside hydrolase family 15 protein [Acerihabitans sp. TG2]